MHRMRALTLVGFLALLSAGCPTIDLGDAPVPPGACNPDPAYYREQIWPEFINSGDTATNCVVEAGCHAVEDGKSALRLEIVADSDIAGQDRNYNVVRRFLNCGSPDISPALTKPLSGQDTHGGGDLFAPGSAQEDLFLAWFDI